MTVGAGSTLTVSGNFSQTSGGSLAELIGGSPASGLFGQQDVTGAATLKGAFAVGLIHGFNPSSGQTFDLISYASETGDFTAYTGLNPFFVESLDSSDLAITDVGINAVDLAAASVTAPTSADVGQSITVDLTATDESTQATSGGWQDSVYISSTPNITSTSTLLGMVPQTSTLDGGDSYSASLTATLSASLAPGYYYILVQVDSLYQQADPDRSNNTLAASTGEINVALPTLALGASYSDSFAGAGEDHYYQITVPAGGSLTVALQSAASSGGAGLYIGQGTLPTAYNYQEASTSDNQPDPTAVVPVVLTPGTYYILAQSVSGAAATASYSITATQTAAVSVSSISPYTGGNAGNATIEIDGANFAPSATATLALDGTTIDDSAMDFVNASQMFATFNLAGAAVGNYTLTVQQGAQTATATHAFQVIAANPNTLNIVLVTPQYVRSGRTGTIIITYTNETQNDIIAPLLDVSSTTSGVYFSTPDDPNNFVQSAQILAVAPSGPAGILRPRQSGQLTLTLLDDNTDGATVPVQVSQIKAGQRINWSSQESALQPPGVPTAAWNTVFGNLLAMIGSTTDSYNAGLAQASTYLSSLGETTAQDSDVGALWSFLVSQADAEFPTPTLTTVVDASLSTPGNLTLAIDRNFISSIDGRTTPGIFGLGWTTSWQSSLTVTPSGNVSISGAIMGYFVVQANGSYQGTDGEYSTLTKTGGIFTLSYPDGTDYVFLSSGHLSYEQDANGNRITLGYNGNGQLTTLTYSNPFDTSEPSEQLSLTYNSQGYVSQVADGTGDVWSYSYDTACHLLSVISPGPTSAGLTTTYTYDTGNNPETVNALLSIAYPDGSQESFTYDARGRISSTAIGGTEDITYTYPGEAEVEATDSTGAKATVWYNPFGQQTRVGNALGGISTSLFDNNGNLISYTNAAGDTSQYGYDQRGDLTQSVNPLGETEQMTYNAMGELTSITDADNNTTQYSYGQTGNLLSITYPDGTQQSFTYDPLGNPTQTIEQNGDTVSAEYNAQGLISQETFPDGSYETFTYEAHGNLLSAQTYSSSNTLTGTTTLAYNGENELTSITYPNGLSLSYTYNAASQRIQSVDQSGYTINYVYDSLGRLSELTDGANNLIVQYTYNSLGQLADKLNGNGTYTTYAYDADANMTSEINYRAQNTVNSSLAYTYNVLNEMTSMTDANGNVTTYAYDASGELTLLGLPGGATVTYVYNADGDRTEVLNSGTPTSYSSNDDNEITQGGAETYTYDAKGNLSAITDAMGTTTFTYNSQNQLISISAPDGTVTAFQYSPLGYLAGETVDGTQTSYLVDPASQSVLSAYSGGSLIADYNYGLGLVSQTGPSGTGYYDFDASGNTIGITGSSGTYVNQYSYLPFGETTTISATLPNPFQFGGQVGIMTLTDGLDYMRARDYVVSTGQFASNDPLGLNGGDTNVRRYTMNQPTDMIDPSGKLCIFYGQPFQNGGPNNFLGYSLGASKGISVGVSSNVFQATVGIEVGIGTTVPGVSPIEEGPTAGIEATYGVAVGQSFGYSHGSTYGVGIGIGWGNCPPPPPPPPPPPSNPGPTNPTHTVDPEDPNALVGPAGYGSQGYIDPTGSLPYTVDFENDGSAAAQDVTVTEQLASTLDWTTFQLGSFGFGPVNFTVPAGLTQYQTVVSYQNSDGSTVNVQISMDFDVATGLLTVDFISLDPLTGQAPAGVFDGFFYPASQNLLDAEGYVQYTVQPIADLPTGAAINQQASVVFDINGAAGDERRPQHHR